VGYLALTLFKKIGAGLYSPTPNIIEPKKPPCRNIYKMAEVVSYFCSII